MLRYAYPRSSEGPSPETSRRRSGEWRPAAAARNRSAPGGSGPRPPGTTTWLRGARSTDPEEMPEKEARPPAQNRHGGAPRGERVPLDARRASPGVDGRASRARQQKLAPFGAPLAPHGVDGTEESKTRAQQRAAGTKKTALFDIVNRNNAATRLVPAERVPRRASRRPSRVPAKRAPRRCFCARRRYARASRDPGATEHDLSVLTLRFTSLFALGPGLARSPGTRKRSKLLHLGAGEPDDLLPLLGFGAHEGSELLGA